MPLHCGDCGEVYAASELHRCSSTISAPSSASSKTATSVPGKTTLVSSISFDEDRLIIGYLQDPDALRLDGSVLITRTMVLMRSEEYREQIEKIEAAVKSLIVDVVEDYEVSTPVPISEVAGPPPEDDDGGMGW